MLLLARLSGSLVAGEKALFKGGGKQRQHGNETCTADQRGGNHKTQVGIQGRLLNERKSRPPSCCTKTTPLWLDYVRSKRAVPAEVAAVLNGPALREAATAPSVFGGYRCVGVSPATAKASRNYSNSSRKG